MIQRSDVFPSRILDSILTIYAVSVVVRVSIRFVDFHRFCLLARSKLDATQWLGLDLLFSLSLQLSPILADKQSETSRLGHLSTAVG